MTQGQTFELIAIIARTIAFVAWPIAIVVLGVVFARDLARQRRNNTLLELRRMHRQTITSIEHLALLVLKDRFRG